MARRNEQAQALQPVAPLKPVEQRDFYNVPDSTASNLILETLGAGADIADLPARKRQVNHSTTLEVYEDGQRRQVQLKTQKASVTIELADIDKLTGSNKPAKKLFVLALIKANEQAIHDGQLTKNYVSFPLQELIDTGFYSTPQSARKGFNTGMDTLTSLKIKGHIQQTKKKGSSIDALEVLFTGARIERGQCTIYFNERISWSFIAQYFTILPRYYFRLPNRASDLLYYIFYLARQHTRDIEERGYFTIGFRAIQHRLQLPSEVGNNNPYKTIKKPIEEAIEELETEHSNLYRNTEFSLLPVCDDTAPIAEYLDNGYLKVGLTGAFAETFIAISKDMDEDKEKKCILAEELGHHFTAVGDITGEDTIDKCRQEKLGRRWGFEALLPIEEIIDVIINGYDCIYTAAEQLDVTPEYLQEALIYYSQKYGPEMEYGDYVVTFSSESLIVHPILDDII